MLCLTNHCLLMLNQVKIIYFTFLTKLNQVRLIYMVLIKYINYYGSKLVCKINVRLSLFESNPFNVMFECKN